MPRATTHEDRCGCRVIHSERIAQARRQALERDEIARMAELFKAVADSSRLSILWALRHGEMCVCDLAALLAISESAVSHQLRLLRTLRLVSNRRDGVILYYRLNDDHIEQLLDVALAHERE
ncbi:MAG: ArsR/SmtB family transcription factor [Thermodesulfobacteriota bacterium]